MASKDDLIPCSRCGETHPRRSLTGIGRTWLCGACVTAGGADEALGLALAPARRVIDLWGAVDREIAAEERWTLELDPEGLPYDPE